MATQNDIGICNYGLTLLSTSTIESFTQNDENARKCNAVYTFIRDELLEDHDWGFAREEASLALLATSPTTEDWEYAHQLPVDCIAVRHMESDLLYKVVSDTVYTNHTSPKIIYTKQVTDPGKFSKLFATALGARIAATLAFGITQNAAAADRMMKVAVLKLSEAKWSDSQQGVGNTPIVGDLITERQI